MTLVQQNPLIDEFADSQNPANDDSDREEVEEQKQGPTTTYEDDCQMEDPFFNIEKVSDWQQRIAHYP